MLRCTDGSIYTGMTNDIESRFNEHLSGTGAKYTKSHQPEKLETVWRSKTKSLACKLEYQLKQLTKKQKERVIQGEKLSTYLNGKVDCRRYYKIKREKIDTMLVTNGKIHNELVEILKGE